MSSPELSQTFQLLSRLHSGDGHALGALLERDLPWIRAQVEKQLGKELRRHFSAEDIVQETMVQILRDGPRFTISDQAHFRALLARMITNVLRMKHRFLHQERRDVGRETALHSRSAVLDLDASQTRPSQAAIRSETQAWMQLCMDLLDPKDREVIVLRQWQELSFVEIGTKLEIDQAAARMRFERALARLARLVKRAQTEGIAAVLAGPAL